MVTRGVKYDVPKTRLMTLYVAQGLPINDMATTLDCHRSTVLARLREADIRIRGSRLDFPYSDADLSRMYVEEGLSYREIGKRENCSPMSVRDRLLRIGVKPRNAKLDLSGKRFGRLCVLSPAETKRYTNGAETRWKCRCDCGTLRTVSTWALRSGNTRSCGCLHIERIRKPPGESALTEAWHQTVQRAKQSGLPSDISRDAFAEITARPCFYCGLPPSNVTTKRRGVSESSHVHSGLDRIDNDKGYTLENVVPCCRTCNYAKRKMDVGAFYDWIKRAHGHLELSGWRMP